tara:strand:+ start:1820 stop:2353 length:534 start_codon:yes stop_codon:yes gene_type:complete
MKRKVDAKNNVKIENKKNIYLAGCSRNATLATTPNSKPYSYHNFLKRKNTRCLCPDTVNTVSEKLRNVVKDRINSRIPASQKILDKKLAILQRIRCDLKENPVTNKKKTCPVSRESRPGVGYTRKESILRFCNTTKDLNYAGQGRSYAELYASLQTEKAFRCDDQKNNANAPCKSMH